MKHITRPWGTLTTFKTEEHYLVKEIVVPPGKQCSLHVHQNHDEHWVIVSGTGKAIVGDKQIELKPNVPVHLPAKLPHRVMNTGNEPLIYIEVVYGNGPADEDVEKLERTYDIDIKQ